MNRLYASAVVCLLAACSDSNNIAVPPAPEPAPPPPPPPSAVFEVSAVNLTVGQPLSPLAAIVHDDSFRAFTVGQPASPGLELLAEGGDSSGLLDEVDGRAEVAGEAPVGPGATDMLTLELDSDVTAGAFLTVMTMLVNTNDAFTGLNALDLSTMDVGDTMVRVAVAYDSGTEANSEGAGSMPGPADGGEGFNAARDDLADQVTMHSGVVTGDDGLGSSVLDQTHRFDNPVVRLTISRTQ